MDPSITPHVTLRQHQLWKLLETGSSNLQLANHAGITEKTVKSTLSRLYAAIDAQNRAHAAILHRDVCPICRHNRVDSLFTQFLNHGYQTRERTSRDRSRDDESDHGYQTRGTT